MLLSCHAHVLEWIYNLEWPECQGSPCSKQARYLILSDSNGIRSHNHLVRKRTLIHLAKRVSQTEVLVYELSGYGFEWLCRHLITWSSIHFLSSNHDREILLMLTIPIWWDFFVFFSFHALCISVQKNMVIYSLWWFL